MTEKIIRVGSRKSKLALAQTNLVIKKLKKIDPNLKFKIVKINTKGDQIHHKPLREVFDDGKNAFTSEIQKALKKGAIDIAIHSMKDVAGNIKHKELIFAAFLPRESAADVIITKSKKYDNLKKLPKGFVIGTVSARRKAAILRVNQSLVVRNLRGNVQTRVEKLKGTYKWVGHKKMDYDAIVMAKSAIIRSGKNLDLKGLSYFEIPFSYMLPAAGQGTIGVECKKVNLKIYNLLKKINHKQTEIETIAEREFLHELGGNCHTVIGVYAKMLKGYINLSAELSDENGKYLYKISSKSKSDPAKLGVDTAKKLKNKIIKLKGKFFLTEVLNVSSA